MSNELSEKVYPDGTVVKLRDDTAREQLAIEKVPNSFITLQSGIIIHTNQLYKQGNHIFGWITFGFSAQTPTSLKLGVLNSGYQPSGVIRMVVGLGTEAWKSEYVGYCLKDTDHSLSITGYNSNIKGAHIHLDYVV